MSRFPSQTVPLACTRTARLRWQKTTHWWVVSRNWRERKIRWKHNLHKYFDYPPCGGSKCSSLNFSFVSPRRHSLAVFAHVIVGGASAKNGKKWAYWCEKSYCFFFDLATVCVSPAPRCTIMDALQQFVLMHSDRCRRLQRYKHHNQQRRYNLGFEQCAHKPLYIPRISIQKPLLMLGPLLICFYWKK